jgi:hypothetical protein
VPKPPLCNENLLINELIREYLLFNNYHFTASTLLAGTREGGKKKMCWRVVP